MGEKDVIEKTLESYNDVFADIFNVLLFNGEEEIKAENLKEAAPNSMLKAFGKVTGQERDIAKYYNGALCQMALLGIENQTKIDKTMPIRIMSYDGAAYKNQLKKKGKYDLYPVVTIVLYFGKGKWTKPLKLSDIIDFPDKIKPFVVDYKTNVFSIGELSCEIRKKFTSDFKHVAEFFHCNNHNIPYKGSKEKVKHFFEILEFLKVMSNDKNINQIYNDLITNKNLIHKEATTMCFVIDDAMNRGRKEGQEEIILKMLEDNMSDELIKKYTGVSSKELEKIKSKLVLVK